MKNTHASLAALIATALLVGCGSEKPQDPVPSPDVFSQQQPAMVPDASSLFPVDTIAVPRFPELGRPRTLAPSRVSVYAVDTASAGNPASPGMQMKMRVYLPPGDHAPQSLGCVLVPPAGTNLLIGVEADDGDYHDETLPYAEAGFAVVHYSLDGDLPDLETATNWQLSAAYGKFKSACAGVVNGRNAVEFVLAKLPQVDPRRIYSAGHSSAGVLSLLLAEHEPRIAGCIAYAAASDVELRMSDLVDEPGVEHVLPGIRGFIKQSSPTTHVAKLRCPVFLFHARDDSNEPFDTSVRFGEALRRTNESVVVDLVPRGDHYDSMIDEGIPRAIQWLKRLPTETPSGS